MDLLAEDNEEKAESKVSAESKNATPTATGVPETADQKLQKAIDEERKKKGMLLDNMRRFKRRLSYKLAEKEAVAKLAGMSKKSTKNIGFLRRRKENLEFRISTEAFTLDAEKELIRKKNEVEEELQEAINSYRLRRKSEFVASDIEDLNKKIEETEKGLAEIEKKLDDLYGGLRKSRGYSQQRPRKQEIKSAEVSFADIAVIKDKKEDKKNGNG